jgi:hypothetical protein
LTRDKALLKLIAKGTQTRRPNQVQSALMRRHFLELTQSFIIPLERYFARLMPLQKSISPYKVCVVDRSDRILSFPVELNIHRSLFIL